MDAAPESLAGLFGERSAPVDSDPSASPPGAATLDEVVAERDELAGLVMQVRADFENYRKRIQRDGDEASRRAVREFITALLPVLDTFALALASIDPGTSSARSGLEHAHAELWQVCTRFGLQQLVSDGVPFDPSCHDAVAHEPGDGDGPTVVETLRAGYHIGDVVVRPAMVKVRG